MKRTLGKFFPGIILLALVSILSPTDAYASVIAKTSNSTAQTITSVTFKVAPEATTNGTSTGLITWASSVNNTDFFAYYVNTGTVNTTAFSWTVAQTVVGAGSFTLDYCPINTTYSSPTLCSDSSAPTTMSLTGTGPALTVGQWRPIHMNIVKKSNTFTVASTVSRSQIRAATNTVG